LWIMRILLAALFLFAGLPKLLMPDKAGPISVHYGYAPWFTSVIGVWEVLGRLDCS
jgi:uncharacterized membrane protein YphA (DoxX/SURF4 family)